MLKLSTTVSEFQSTLPVRGATKLKKIQTMYGKFQSTLPVKGATRLGFTTAIQLDISIHAPGKGSEAKVNKYSILFLSNIISFARI